MLGVMSTRLEKWLTALGIVGSLVISAISLGYSILAFNIANSYPASLDLANISPLVVTENCSPAPSTPSQLGNLTTNTCYLTGAFNVSFSIVSPHAGTYNITIQPFSPSPSYLITDNLTFLGRNLTLISFNVSDTGYLIKARNETSGHFAYFAFIGSLPPSTWTVQTPFEISGDHFGVVTANGFEKTAVISVNGMINRFGGSGPTGRMEYLGTLTGTLVYHDIPLGRYYHLTFTVDVFSLR